MSVNSALIRFIYPRRWLGRGVGLNATVGSIASALGPSVASAHPGGGAMAMAVRGKRAAGHPGRGHRAAHPAADAAVGHQVRRHQRGAAGGGVRHAAVRRVRDGPWRFVGRMSRWNWSSPRASGFVLVVRQLSRTAPLLPVDLLRIPLFALSVATSVCSFIAQSIAQVSMPFLFEHRFEHGPGDDRTADDALAAGGGGDRAVRRAAGGQVSRPACWAAAGWRSWRWACWQ